MACTYSTFWHTYRMFTSSFLSASFQPIDLQHLQFPAKMYIDYVRVYQRDDAPGIGCSPEDYPTESYINKYEFWSSALSKELTRR